MGSRSLREISTDPEIPNPPSEEPPPSPIEEPYRPVRETPSSPGPEFPGGAPLPEVLPPSQLESWRDGLPSHERHGDRSCGCILVD